MTEDLNNDLIEKLHFIVTTEEIHKLALADAIYILNNIFNQANTQETSVVLFENSCMGRCFLEQLKNDTDDISIEKVYKKLSPKTMKKDLKTPCMVILRSEFIGSKYKTIPDFTTCHDTHSFLNYVLFFINTRVFRGDELREVLPEVLKNKNIISILKNHTIKNPEKVGKPFETRKHNGITEIICKL